MINPESQLIPELERQHIATTYIDLTRHGSRFGGKIKIEMPDGSEFEVDDGTDLTPAGKATVKESAQVAFPADVLLVHPRGGDESRHGETGEDLIQGSKLYGPKREALNTPASIRDKQGRVKLNRRGVGVDYVSAGLGKSLKPFIEIIMKKLQEIVNQLSPKDLQEFKVNSEYRAKLREQAQVYGLEKALESDSFCEILAENEAYELMHCLELSRRGVKPGTSAAIPVVGSGLFAESLFKRALIIEDQNTNEHKVGFKDVSEIGGFTKQATAFRIKLERDDRLGDNRNMSDFDKDTKIECSFTDPERAGLMAGKRFSLDWGIVKKLAAKAKERLT